MNIALLLGVAIYWFVSRIYIAREISESKNIKHKKTLSDGPWSQQAISFLKNLNLGKAFSLATIGTITLLFFGIFCGVLICVPAAVVEMALQTVFRVLYITVLFILYIAFSMKENWRAKFNLQLQFELKRLVQVYWEFIGIFIVTVRELVWWCFPTIPYLRLPVLIRFDRYPYSAERKDAKPALQTAWFSYDLWKSLPFFNERPYPDGEI